MGHEIDLKNYKIRTDLAIESIENDKIDGIKQNYRKIDNIKITDIEVDKVGSNKIEKKEGRYITIEFDDVTDFNNREKVTNVFSTELKKMLKVIHINDNSKCLVIGLGNSNSTPDSLGPLSIDNIIVTKHLYDLGDVDDSYRNVSVIKPGVTGETGIETSDIITSVVSTTNPDFVIVVDALASSSVERVNKTIQMTDTGIHPGSGIGNSRKEISVELLKVPVIAIGIPTVVDAVTIVTDTINYMSKHFSYMKENINNPINKLVPITNINYLKKEININVKDKKELLGFIGHLNDNEIRQLIFEVLTPIGYNLMVTPKEIDFIIEKLSEVIGNGINKALHKNIN